MSGCREWGEGGTDHWNTEGFQGRDDILYDTL